MKQQLERRNSTYKEVINQWRSFKEFKEGDMVMVYLENERFLSNSYNKLKYQKIGHCSVMRKINKHVYKVDLISD